MSVTATWRRNLRRRTMTVGLCMTTLAFALFVVALMLGQAGLSPTEVLEALTGRGDRITNFVVLQNRLPRALAAALVGGCLGASGAVFQAVLRNPLASPDIIGVTSTAGTAGVVGVLLLGLSGLPLTLLVAVGGVVGAAIVAGLTWNRGLVGMRLVLVGIGVAAVATAFTSYLITTVDSREAAVAYTWLVGSLNGAGWPVVTVTAVVGILALVALALQARGLRALELGDATAAGLGFRVERTRILVMLTAVVLASVAVGAAGPVGFVALMAPQIARRLVGHASASPAAATAVGAALVIGADLIAQYAVSGVNLPVGVVTGALGAPYLAWLLARNDINRPGGRS
ncbi:FecCD family ABC transporter permease [Tessaracoccus lacteus]|uniref:Iron chelate uptake ABC transporter family permease subunit n=1 Tax=Tessaracoccus lacteus TaxID=3041766 RepID=A0ABY8Q0N7_9ACTN|nr:iron chelate uptake ABC transporter family permease subunit [Tessaracoccus sp. T21]WGT48267.1 iron chelate uptake ABC transporter family permease subunit [Tessaracoccus sp. T21]